MTPFHFNSVCLRPRFSGPSNSTVPALAWTAILLGALMPLTAHAQSAENFKPVLPQPAVVNDTKAAPKSAPMAEGPISNLPSRYIGEAEVEPYIASITSMFSMRRREIDPFGQFQDPNAKPIIKTPIAKSTRVAPMQATPFADIIRLIKVTTIMPGEKKFLIGTRAVSQGERIPLAFRGKNILVEVAAVSSDRIQFRNVENGETAELSLLMMPPGMKAGNDGIHAPGMMPDNPNAPIDLDGNTLPLNSVQIR